MRNPWIAAGALCCALAVIAGAFGAHALRQRLAAEALAQWETAARYLIYGGFGLVLLGLAGAPVERPALALPAALLLAGTLLFSGTVFGLALGGPRWLGALTPLGGALMIVAFLLFAWSAVR
jgi:uncharacterized membrane protein YgdD (TMEM256/DUF423 family)